MNTKRQVIYHAEQLAIALEQSDPKIKWTDYERLHTAINAFATVIESDPDDIQDALVLLFLSGDRSNTNESRQE